MQFKTDVTDEDRHEWRQTHKDSVHYTEKGLDGWIRAFRREEVTKRLLEQAQQGAAAGAQREQGGTKKTSQASTAPKVTPDPKTATANQPMSASRILPILQGHISDAEGGTKEPEQPVPSAAKPSETASSTILKDYDGIATANTSGAETDSAWLTIITDAVKGIFPTIAECEARIINALRDKDEKTKD